VAGQGDNGRKRPKGPDTPPPTRPSGFRMKPHKERLRKSSRRSPFTPLVALILAVAVVGPIAVGTLQPGSRSDEPASTDPGARQELSVEILSVRGTYVGRSCRALRVVVEGTVSGFPGTLRYLITVQNVSSSGATLTPPSQIDGRSRLVSDEFVVERTAPLAMPLGDGAEITVEIPGELGTYRDLATVPERCRLAAYSDQPK
jgi:hypothetical protein